MKNLEKPWPFTIGRKSWWLTALAAVVALAIAAAVDEPLSLWAQSWPAPIHDFMARITNLGLSDWELIPSVALFVLSALLALGMRSRPYLSTALWQVAAATGFIFAGVGLPSLFTNLVKHVVGRGRPQHLLDAGVFAFHPNLFSWDFQSFPSGHTTTIFATAMVAAFFWSRLFYPAMVIAVVVGVSRIVVGAHYPSDVVAGIIVGVLGAYVVRWLFARRRWVFEVAPDGGIRLRPPAAMTRLVLTPSRSARARPPGRP